MSLTSSPLVSSLVLVVGLALPGAGCFFWSSGDDLVCEGDERLSPKVYYGTLEPTHVPLSPGQILAIGDFAFCSGTLIAPDWVLTAKHCRLTPGAAFCMGPDPADPDVCIFVAQVVPHPDPVNDLALVMLNEDARVRLPEVEPIPIMTEVMGSEWIGALAEGAGYGLTELQTSGTRYFTAEPIRAVDGRFVVVDGEGSRGLCNGDSGGPLMVIAGDATVRVAGSLYGGDASCVGRDSYTRTDLFAAWIEMYAGPTSSNPAECGSFDHIGGCFRGRAVWCENDMLHTETCDEGTACGWDGDQNGFRCISGVDSCGGFDRRGGCDGATAKWCEDGALRERNCASCDMACDIAAVPEGAYCRWDACKGLGFQGHCDGDVAEWCEGGELQTQDCSATSQTCGWVNEQIGYYCI